MNWDTLLKTLLEFVVSYGGRLLIALLLTAVGFKLVNVLCRRFRKGKVAARMDHAVASFLNSFIMIACKSLLVVTAITILGVPMSSVVAVLATASAAIGLALQGSLSNFAGGIMLLIFKPFRLDDYIETSEGSGTVREISTFYTVLDTPDNKRVTLPNGMLMNSTITNYSANDTRRVDLLFSVAYESDLDRVREVLQAVADAHPSVMKEPAPKIVLSKQNESSLDVSLRVWCKREDYWTVFFELNETAKKAFDRTGIQIPFPQLDVHMKS